MAKMKAKTTVEGYINKNNQKNLGYRGVSETHYNQSFFEMECLECGYRYMANGCDVWLRKCPECQTDKKPANLRILVREKEKIRTLRKRLVKSLTK